MRYIPPFQGWFLLIPDTQGAALGWYILPLRGVGQAIFIYHSLASRSTSRWQILPPQPTWLSGHYRQLEQDIGPLVLEASQRISIAMGYDADIVAAGVEA